MSHEASTSGQSEFLVPGTCFTFRPRAASPSPSGPASVDRDPALRDYYLSAALGDIPRLLGAIDRNPYRATYGCLDRQYWHYLTSSFPSEMYQEGVLPLALVYATELPGNRWYADRRVRELATAAIRFAARSSHADGSCDDYYPFERALGAAVFSLQATAQAYLILEIDDPELVAWFRRRADWVIDHGESGHLANHQALAALGLLRVAHITGEPRFRQAADARIDRLLAWQSDEGWFEEYGGADPGYQTVTIDCLAKVRRITDDGLLDEPLRRAVAFARLFLHPDHSYGGEYGSRGTYHFYPHGMELLAAQNAEAADLADGFLQSLRSGSHAHFNDDRLVAHRPANLIEAYLDWSPVRPAQVTTGSQSPPTHHSPRPTLNSPQAGSIHYLPHAGLLVRRAAGRHTVISAARGGVFKHFAHEKPAITDAGLVVETTDGRVAVSQWHDRARDVRFAHGGEDEGSGMRDQGSGAGDPGAGGEDRESGASNNRSRPPSISQPSTLDPHLSSLNPHPSSLNPQPSSLNPQPSSLNPHPSLHVSGPLHWARWETATPLKQALLHVGMCSIGRFCRTLVRRLLQRRLITGRRECPIRLTRSFEFLPESDAEDAPSLRIEDVIELTGPRIRVRRMAFGTDHQAAYVAASGVYQQGVLAPWVDLARHVDDLNMRRRVTIVREV